jgi:hypothetical protein
MSYPILFGNTASAGGGINPFPARYFILDPVNVRDSGAEGNMQMSEFWILNGGTRLGGTWSAWDLSFTTAGVAPSTTYPANERPDMANDNNTSTKWLDARGKNGGLFIDLGSQQATTGYTWWTANDSPNRDMTDWIVYASKTNNSDWAPVSSITGFNPTTSRFTQVGSWSWDSSLYG